MGDQGGSGSLPDSSLPQHPACWSPVSLVKLHKHLPVLSAPLRLLSSCPSQNSPSPARLANQVPSPPPPSLRAKPHPCSKSFVAPLQSQEQSRAAQQDTQGPPSPASGALFTSWPTGQTNPYSAPETQGGCSLFSPSKLLSMLQNPAPVAAPL